MNPLSPRRAFLLYLIIVLSWSVVITPALAQDAADPPMGDSLPSLDELLGTEGTASENTKAPDLPKETVDEALDRLLSGQEIVDEFRAAADLMNRSARRLATSRDTGLATQRMQEDILRKLDTLIADAQQRSQQSSGSSSSSPSQQPQSTPQPAQTSTPQSGRGDNRSATPPPGNRTGPLGPEQAADLAAWGALPSRMRDALLQGSSDRFSATYRRLTEAYYRTLAEESKK